MDYAQEQADEIEALQSIYTGYFDVLSESPWKFLVAVDPEAAQERSGDSAEPVRLEITFTEKYPDQVPEVEIKYSHILSKHATALKRHVMEQAEELLGNVMVFSLVSAAKEWLETQNLSTAQDWGGEEEDEDEGHRNDRNKAGILKGIVGVTPVTEETFMAWRAKFDAEVDLSKSEMTAEMKEKLSRPTGRQLFERDASLYMDADTAEVGFNDPSLFAEEDLPDDDDDDDDDDEDDEDYDEGAGIDEALFQTLDVDDDLPDSDEEEES